LQRNLTVDEEASWVRKIASTTADCNMGGAYPTCPYHRRRLFCLMFIAGAHTRVRTVTLGSIQALLSFFVRSPGHENIT